MNKLNNVSLLRLFSALMIFLFHILKYWTEVAKKFFPFYFTVQVFLFLSGFLYGPKKINDTKEFYKKNTIKVIVPVIIFVALISNIFCICKFFRLNLDADIGNLWFTYAILLCYLITPLLDKLKHKIETKTYDKTFKSLLFLIILFLIMDISLLTINQSLLISFVAGYMLRAKQHTIAQKQTNHHKVLHIIFPLIIFIALSVLYYFVYNYFNLNDFVSSLIKEFIIALMGITFSIFALEALSFTNKYNFGKFLSFTDKNSYHFYIVQQIFITGTFSVQFLTSSIVLNSLIAFIFVFIFGIVLQFLSDLFFQAFSKK